MVSQLLQLAQWCYSHHLIRGGMLAEKLMILFCGAHISGRANIHKSVNFPHGGIGVVVNPAASIDKGCIIGPHVVLGNRYPHTGAPSLGKNVYVGVGAKVIGGVKIGSYAIIGANAVVISDVPEGGVAVGVPAKVIKVISNTTNHDK